MYLFDDNDVRVVEAARLMCEKICASNLVVGTERTGLRSLGSQLQKLPDIAFDDADFSICLRGPTRYFDDRKITLAWVIECCENELKVESSGYFWRPCTGGDSFISFSWLAVPGCYCECMNRTEHLRLVDDPGEFLKAVPLLDLSEDGYTVELDIYSLLHRADKDVGESEVGAVAQGVNESRTASGDPLLAVEGISERFSEFMRLGYESLVATKVDGLTPKFESWRREFEKLAADVSMSFEETDAKWVWNSLRNHDVVKMVFGELREATPLSAIMRNQEIEFLPAGSTFQLAFSKSEVDRLLLGAILEQRAPQVLIRLLEPLRMRRGTANRLALCDVECEVTLFVSDTKSPEIEASIMGVKEDTTTIEEGIIRVQAKSLNQAYTIASKRFEPGRRSHGGRVYDRALYMDGDRLVLLEDLRWQLEQRITNAS